MRAAGSIFFLLIDFQSGLMKMEIDTDLREQNMQGEISKNSFTESTCSLINDICIRWYRTEFLNLGYAYPQV